MTKIYTADAVFADGQWQATVRDLPGAHTYAKTIPSLRKRLREVIVLMDDRPDSDVQDEDAFAVGLAIEVHVTDDAGMSDSVSVAVRPATVETRGSVQGAAQSNLPAVSSAATASLELTAGAARPPKPAATTSLELKAGASLATPSGSARGHLTFSGSAVGLSGSGTLSAGAAAPPHEVVAYARALRERAEAAEAEADHATRIAILLALDAGMGMRDVAAILGISFQRVSQIAGEAGGVPTRRRTRA